MNQLVATVLFVVGLFVVGLLVGPVTAMAEDPPDAPGARTTDAAGVVSVRLPEGWRPVDSNGRMGVGGHGLLGAWRGRMASGRRPYQAWLDVFVSRDGKRPIQVLTRLTSDLRPRGRPTTGDGWVEGSGEQVGRATHWFRCVEQEGLVVVFCVTTSAPGSAANAGEDVSAILRSTRVVGAVTPPPPPAGTTARRIHGFDVWATDAPKDELRSLVDAIDAYRTMALKELTRKPVDTSRPVVWVFDDADAFAACARTGTWHTERPRPVAYLPHAGAIGVLRGTVDDENDATSIFAVAAVDQALSQWFGGAAPPWLQGGLRNLLARAKRPDLDPHDASSAWISTLKQAVDKRDTRLDSYLALSGPQITALGGLGITIAYHEFFRAANQSSRWRMAYRKSLDAVRETGDPAAATAAWSKTNHGALSQAFTDWVRGRK